MQTANEIDFAMQTHESIKLTPGGEIEVVKLGEYFHEWKMKIDMIVSSTYTADYKSAVILSKCFGIQKKDILRESQLVEYDINESNEWHKGKNNKQQIVSIAKQRVHECFTNLIKNLETKEKTIFIVAHAAPISWIISYIDGKQSDLKIENASYTFITYNEPDTFSVSIANCTEHL